MLKLLRNVGAGRVCAANRRLFSTAATRSAFVQVFNGPKATPAFESKDMPLPTLGEGEVLVKTELATICGSDLHTILGTRKEPTPLVLGHEAVGIVVETGPKPASHVKVGDRITWSIADSCGTCPPCTDYDLPQKCDKLFKYGHASITDGTGLNGCYGTHIIVRKGTHITKVPSHLPLGLVAPANCALATVCNALDIPIRKTDTTALVQGAGLLGLYSCALLKTKGFKTVFCTDIHPGRLEMVKEFGAVPLPGDALQRKVRQEAIQNAAPHGVDICVEVAGSSSLVPEAIQTLRFGGHYALVGMVHPHSQLTSTTGEMIIRKCITIRGSHNYAPRHLDQAIEFLSKHHKDFPFHKLISPPFSLRDLEQAVKEAESQKWARVSIDPTK